MRLFKAILLLMLVASVVPTVMVGTFATSDTREILVRNAQELSGERVRQLMLKTEMVLGDPTRAAIGLARIPGFFSLRIEQQRAHMAAVLNQRRDLLALTAFDANGRRIPGLQAIASLEIPPTEVAEHEARARALIAAHPTGVVYSEVFVQPQDGQPGVTLVFPVGDRIRGYIAAELSLDRLTRMLAQERVGSTGFAYVTDAHGHVVAASAQAGLTVGQYVSDRPLVQDLLRTLAQSPDSEIFRVGNFGAEKDRVVGAYTVLDDARWAVLSEQPLDLAYLEVSTMKRKILLGLLTALAVAIGLAAVFSRTVTRPLKGFMASAMEIARGKFGTVVEIRARNELGDLGKTFNYMSQQLLAYDSETRALYENLEKGYLETIVALANSIDSKDAYTRGHSQRVADMSVEIARELGLPEHELKRVRYGGILHDIGKIGIIESILLKQSQLTSDEMTVMREHPVIGDSIIEPITFLQSVRAAIRNHHERWDGTGYPDKLAGDKIPLIARIVACADTFDACTSTRPYQKAMPLSQAMGIMEKLRGASLDPGVVDALSRVVSKKGATIEGHRDPVKLAS